MGFDNVKDAGNFLLIVVVMGSVSSKIIDASIRGYYSPDFRIRLDRSHVAAPVGVGDDMRKANIRRKAGVLNDPGDVVAVLLQLRSNLFPEKGLLLILHK